MVRVLVVEDEVGLAQSLDEGLRDHGFTVQVTHDGFSGYRLAKEAEFDLIVLDWMLPGMSGVEMCHRLRSEDVAVPILILTAKDGTTDETDALEHGADDYLRKPFTFSVLIARCDALLRRGSNARVERADRWRPGLRSPPPGRGAARADRSQPARGRVARVPHARRRRDPLEGGDPARRLGRPRRSRTNLVEVYVGYLRKKLDTPFDAKCSRTVRGKGYRLEAP